MANLLYPYCINKMRFQCIKNQMAIFEYVTKYRVAAVHQYLFPLLPN